ncbi:conserved oligomeric Golgi complex subunit 7 isoform X3 [Periplaneta americana]|uniref:conserved oligomeric Golgi complex subunit 7 isoform X3 n=1 Tax=Periplaneta americana TaxID=6978 RepID=UPI0037E7C9DE
MDVAAFSDDNFEVKDWINKTFKSAEAQENRDAFVSSLVMKLQLYVQQVNSALEDTSQQVLQSLPRVMRDTEILHQEALLLRDKMHSVKQEIAKVEQDTGLSMATLEHIDRIKTELQASKQALHEADNWTILATDMEEVFESGDIENIYTKLVSMQQSLRILANVPDYEDRKLQLEGLKNRLEAMASPMLVQALTSASVEQSQLFVRIFTAIDRLPQLLKYYHKCQKGILMQQWRNIVEMEQDEGVAEWMHKFYDVLLSNWHDQVKWCGQVFTSAPTVNTLVDLYVDTLTSLDPSFNICIDAALKQQSNHLSFLMELQQITKHFSVNLQVAVDSASHGELLSQLKQLDRDLTRSLLDVSRKLNSQEVNSFVQYKKLLLSAAGQTELDALVSSIQEGEETLLIEHITLSLNKLCSNVHHTTFQVIFAPISVQLELVQSASANSQAMTVAPDLPDFSFAPQEYITQIGQYLMTLPQHLEPFMLQDNPSLTLALHVADAEYGMLSGETEGGFADVLLAIIARGTCQTYCDNILGICELGPSACKQLATDIDYLGNVLEDLGLTLPEHLQQLSMLLRLTPDEYQTKSSGCSPRLVAAVRQMRNITSS